MKDATAWLIEELKYWLDGAEDCVLSDDDAAKIKQGREAIAFAESAVPPLTILGEDR